MESFFDFREFMMLILKKRRFILILVVLGALLLGGTRAYPLFKQYKNDTPPVQTEEKTLADSFLPHTYAVQKSFCIDSASPKTLDEMSVINDYNDKIVAAYTSLQQAESVVTALTDSYFVQTKNLEMEARVKLVELNYQFATSLTDDYTVDDFRKVFTVTANSPFITFSVSTYSKTLSEKMSEEYTAAIIKMGNQLFPHKLKMISTVTNKTVPVPATSNPRTNVDTGKNSVMRPTLSDVLTKGVKGAIIGAGAGLLLALVCLFFVSVVDNRLQDVKQLASLKLSVLSGFAGNRKKKRRGVVDRLIDKWEHNVPCDQAIEVCAAMLTQLVNARPADSTPTVLLCGSASPVYIGQLAEQIAARKDGAYTLVTGENVNSHTPTVTAAQTADCVILVEQKGYSVVAEIEQELNSFRHLNKEILGCVVVS